MTKKFILLSLILVLGLSFNIYAAEKTIADEKWDNFLETANLQYKAHTGEVVSSFEIAAPLPVKGEDLLENLAWNNNFAYGLTNDLELAGKLNSSTQKVAWDPIKYYTKQYYVAIKDKFVDQGPLVISAKGDANYFRYTNDTNNDIYTTFTLNGTVYSNLVLNNVLTLYNNFNMASKKDNDHSQWFSQSLTNCLELNITERNTMRFMAWTSLNNLSSIQTNLSAIFRSKINDNFTYILNVQNTNSGILNPYLMVNNLVEFKTLPATVITGQFGAALVADAEKNYSLNATQQFGLLTLKAGYSKNITSADRSESILSGGLKFDVTTDCSFGLEVNKDTLTNADVSTDSLKLITGLSLKL